MLPEGNSGGVGYRVVEVGEGEVRNVAVVPVQSTKRLPPVPRVALEAQDRDDMVPPDAALRPPPSRVR